MTVGCHPRRQRSSWRGDGCRTRPPRWPPFFNRSWIRVAAGDTGPEPAAVPVPDDQQNQNRARVNLLRTGTLGSSPALFHEAVDAGPPDCRWSVLTPAPRPFATRPAQPRATHRCDRRRHWYDWWQKRSRHTVPTAFNPARRERLSPACRRRRAEEGGRAPSDATGDDSAVYRVGTDAGEKAFGRWRQKQA